eukprot:763491-Hanusia_phi.AAC.6
MAAQTFIVKSGAGNSGTIGELLNDSNRATVRRRAPGHLWSPHTSCPGPESPGCPGVSDLIMKSAKRWPHTAAACRGRSPPGRRWEAPAAGIGPGRTLRTRRETECRPYPTVGPCHSKFISKSGAGNSGTIGEVLNDSNCLSNDSHGQ